MGAQSDPRTKVINCLREIAGAKQETASLVLEGVRRLLQHLADNHGYPPDQGFESVLEHLARHWVTTRICAQAGTAEGYLYTYDPEVLNIVKSLQPSDILS